MLTALIIQSPTDVYQRIDLDRRTFQTQLENLKKHYTIKVINIGIFGDLGNLQSLLSAFPSEPIIFDPIVSSGSGRFRFLTAADIHAIKIYLKDLYLITPNIPEAELLSGIPISDIPQMKEAAVKLHKDWGIRNIYLKGGHLKQIPPIDLLYSDGQFHTFASEPIGFNIHGSGSFINSAIAAYLFKGESMVSSITKAHALFQRAAKNVLPENPLIRFI